MNDKTFKTLFYLMLAMLLVAILVYASLLIVANANGWIPN